jgi:hypothetical protein
MIPLGKIVSVGKWAMGKSGWLQTAKSGKSNGLTGVVTIVLAKALGLDLIEATALAVALVTAGDALWEVVRTYEVVQKD